MGVLEDSSMVARVFIEQVVRRSVLPHLVCQDLNVRGSEILDGFLLLPFYFRRALVVHRATGVIFLVLGSSTVAAVVRDARLEGQL